MSLTSDVKQMLIKDGITLPIYRSFTPDEANIISLFQTGGRETNKASGISEPTFQIRLRHDDYDTGIKILEDISEYLINLEEVNYGTNRYLSFYAESDIIELGRDENERFNFTINFRCFVERNFVGYELHLKEAQNLVSKAEKTKDTQDIVSAKEKVLALPQDKAEVKLLYVRITNLETYIVLLNEANLSVQIAEASKLQFDHNDAKEKVNKLTLQSDKEPLLNRLAVVQAFINESSRVAIDFGSPEFQSPAPWNNMTGWQEGTKLENLLAMAGNTTNISIEIIKAFDSYDVTGVDEDGLYYAEVIKDYICTPWNTHGILQISGLDPMKNYRITCFGSRADNDKISEYNISQTKDIFINKTVKLDVSHNTDRTISQTLLPNEEGIIYVIVGNYNESGWAYLNALEIQQM